MRRRTVDPRRSLPPDLATFSGATLDDFDAWRAARHAYAAEHGHAVYGDAVEMIRDEAEAHDEAARAHRWYAPRPAVYRVDPAALVAPPS